MTATVIQFTREVRFKPEAFADVHPTTRPALIKGMLPTVGVAFLVGASKAGKSFLALDVALKLSTGADKFQGRKAKGCGVVYVAAEDPDGCRLRIAAWRHRYRGSAPALPFFLIAQPVNLLDDGDLDELRATLTEIADGMAAVGGRLGLVVLDTWSRCIPGADENGSVDTSIAFSRLAALGQSLGLTEHHLLGYGRCSCDAK